MNQTPRKFKLIALFRLLDFEVLCRVISTLIIIRILAMKNKLYKDKLLALVK